jgi:hypothetical protein
VWLIDTVTVSPDGTMTVACRDLARELLEQIMFIPVVPKDYYPMKWELRSSDITGTRYVPQGLFPLSYEKDSNLPYIGSGLVDDGKPYCAKDGSARDSGKIGKRAFDGDMSSYWMSVGNKSRESTSAYEWVQGLTPGAVDVGGVQIKAWGGPYTVYISVKRGGEWSGKRRIGYKANFIDAHTDIKYVKFGKIKKGETKVFRLSKPNGQPWDGVEAIRITLHHLYDSNIGSYPYRGGIYDVKWTPAVTEEAMIEERGNYTDYVEIVKTFLAWGGFYWPRPESGRSYLKSVDGSNTTIAYTNGDDPFLAQGRVWGDIMMSGVGGKKHSEFGPEVWDKKPLIDGIRYVKDIIAYAFFIDEYGGAIFRPPNIYEFGNWVSGADGGPHEPRSTNVVVIQDDVNLFQHSLTLSSLNRRDRIFVANLGPAIPETSSGSSSMGIAIPELETDGAYGAVVKGYDPYPSGTRRISGWTDQRFNNYEEVLVMAQLIAIRQAVKMRSATVERTACSTSLA